MLTSPKLPSLPPLLPPSAHSPLRQAVLAQLAGAALVALMPVAAPGLLPSLLAAAIAQGVCAAAVSLLLKAPRWWLPIHLGFLPTALLVTRLGIAPGWFLAGFILLLLIYWRTDRSQVPLYLSNTTTAAAVLQLLPSTPCRVVDLGCGHGGLLRHLARARPECDFLGIEHAPLPWLWAKVAASGCSNLTIRYGDFWREPLAPFDVVYAFLSPAPMPRLHACAQAQIRPGALLVSNSFAIPGVAPTSVVEVADRRTTQLYCYHFPGLGHEK